jgi:hypothetical protein
MDGARKPKSRDKKQMTVGAELGTDKAWTQVGISRFFMGDTGKLC